MYLKSVAVHLELRILEVTAAVFNSVFLHCIHIYLVVNIVTVTPSNHLSQR
jgi:hypothetical protein